MGECNNNRNNKCQERSGQGLGHRNQAQDVGPMWQGQAPIQRDRSSGGPRSRVGVILGWVGAHRMKK